MANYTLSNGIYSYTDRHGKELLAADILYLTSTASIVTTGSWNGVNVNGNNAQIQVEGSIHSDTSAIHFNAEKAMVTVGTGGKLTSTSDTAATIAITTTPSSGSLTVNNHGTIASSGSGAAIAASNTALILFNTGIISTGSPETKAAITAVDGHDIISNAGLIKGHIHLGLGDDLYYGTSGIVEGYISLGEGEDRAYGGRLGETFDPGAGLDLIDGGGGDDTVIFSGLRSDYQIIVNKDGSLTVNDGVAGRDGSDTLRNVEFLRFRDQTTDLRPPVPGPPTVPSQPNPASTNKILSGTSGKDVLVGGAGNDKLSGRYGNDVLTGGGGQDIFVFNAKLGTAKTDRKVNFDTITDFKPGEDKIWLDNAIFKKLGKGSETVPGKLNKAYFKIGAPKDNNDFLLYDKKTGVVSYDADGKGTRYTAVEVLKVTKNLSLTADDFRII